MVPLINMRKALLYIIKIMKLSLTTELAYKMDFIWFIFMMPVFLASEIFGIYFIFAAGGSGTIAGFTMTEFLFVSSIAAFNWIISSFSPLSSGRITSQIITGDLDTYLLKPISPALSIWFQKIYMKRFLMLFVRIIVLMCLIVFGHISLSLGQISSIAFIVVTSVILYHTFFIFGDSLCFWFSKLEMNEMLFELTEQTVYYPASIYPDIMRKLCTFVIPIFLISNPVYLVLKNTYTFWDMMFTLCMVLLWVGIAGLTWTKGQRIYESAN